MRPSASRIPDTVERVDRMEEELAILRGLWDEPDGWAYEGEHYQVRGSLFRPKGRRPNLIVGGIGKPRSIRLAARYADEYNISSSNPDEVREIMARLDAACEAVGRDPATLARSVMAGVLVGRDEAEMRAAHGRPGGHLRRAPRPTAEAWLDERRDRWILGTPDAARDRLAEYAATGIDRLLFQDFLPRDLDHIELHGRGALTSRPGRSSSDLSADPPDASRTASSGTTAGPRASRDRPPRRPANRWTRRGCVAAQLEPAVGIDARRRA